MSTPARLILVKGEDRTQQIHSLEFVGPRIKIRFKNDAKYYFYNRHHVKIIKSALANHSAKHCFAYLKEIAKQVGLLTSDGMNILGKQYESIDFVHEDSALSAFLTGSLHPVVSKPGLILFPFGFNASQKEAVQKAMKNPLSVIQGPPGTGKTQTILNIIANAVMRGETVAVVSNNNTATANIQEKLQKYGIDFISAYLGNSKNRQDFIQDQKKSVLPKDLEYWQLEKEAEFQMISDLEQLSAKLTEMLQYRNEMAAFQERKRILETEYQHFCQYYHKQYTAPVWFRIRKSLTAGKLLSFMLTYSRECCGREKPSFWQRICFWFAYGFRWRKDLSFQSIIDTVQKQCYEQENTELSEKIKEKEKLLKHYNFEEKMADYSSLSMRLLKSYLSIKYSKGQRAVYNLDELRKNSQQFLRDYPVILSTTYSLRNSLSRRVIYDYVIIDEASQVDLVTGALALSCAKKTVIVGDSQQLPNVVDRETQRKTDDIFRKYKLHLAYSYSQNSFLQSILKRFSTAPQSILREHYRCHPKIIGFCNEKFYNGQLIILSKEEYSRVPLVLYKTVPGNHAREHFNQRQIDVIKSEVFPQENLWQTEETVGIVTPYRQQTNELQKAFANTNVQADTVDKFQGREKDIVILSTVDNQISDFTDQPNRLNVAISRAKKQLIVVTNGNEGNKEGCVQDLVRYIEYNSLKTTHSQVYSVFDYLYQQYDDIRKKILFNKRISEYDSENLMYGLLSDILKRTEFKGYKVAMYVPLYRLLKEFSPLSAEERRYATHPNTHIDFLIYSRIDKSPKLAIEVNGFKYHHEGTKQAQRDIIKEGILKKYGLPLLSFSTIDSGEERKIINKLNSLGS